MLIRTEVHEPPLRFKSGAVVTKTEWWSNGVGEPSMRLYGTTKDYTPADSHDVYYPLPTGGIEPFKPGDGGSRLKAQKKAPKE